jgi:hypothetical protein
MMNTEERQALRKKHFLWKDRECNYDGEPYPCDVIKVLDATEPTVTECDHYGVDSGGTDYYGTSNPPQESDWNYTYCPKCGDKL